METANFCLFAGYGKRKFVFLGRQTINCDRRLLFQQNVPIYESAWYSKLQCTDTAFYIHDGGRRTRSLA
jgi:hypothetical protein